MAIRKKSSEKKVSQVNKESSIKSIWIAVITAVITAVIVSFINYFVWIKQNDIQQNQNLDNYKVQLLEKFTKSTLTMITLCEYRTKIRVLYEKESMKVQDSLKIHTLPPTEYYDKIMDKLKMKYPVEFQKYEESLTYDDEFTTNCALARGFFKSESQPMIDNLQKSFTDDKTDELMLLECDGKKVNFQNIDTNKIVYIQTQYQWKMFVTVLDYMFSEIDPAKRIVKK